MIPLLTADTELSPKVSVLNVECEVSKNVQMLLAEMERSKMSSNSKATTTTSSDRDVSGENVNAVVGLTPLAAPLSLTSIASGRHRSLMESLLARKIEMEGAGSIHPDRRLLRTDSLDSTSSIGSLSEDVCHCDDCLLGIADLYKIGPTESAMARKKVKRCWRDAIPSCTCCDEMRRRSSI